MSSIGSKAATSTAKTVFNPYMSGRILAQQQQSSIRLAGNRAAAFIEKTPMSEAVEIPAKAQKFSMSAAVRSLDQMLMNNIRRLITEEAERQSSFRALHGAKPSNL